MEPSSTLTTILIAAALSAAVIVALRPFAARLGLIDRPDHRKLHGAPVPLIGGIGIATSTIATLAWLSVGSWHFVAFVAAAAILFTVGLLDDRMNLSPRQRLVAQAAAALLMIYGGGQQVSHLGDLFGTGDVTIGWFAVPFTVFCVVGLINAFNMADGVDGLAGSLALVSAVAFAVVVALAGATAEVPKVLALVGALLGFLLFNWRHRLRPFRVFMGDAGSMFVGFALVWMAVAYSQDAKATLYPMAAVWILGLPVLDTVATLLRRMQMGHSPFHPDRTHLHHLLLNLGLRPSQVVLTECAVAGAMATIGVMSSVYRIPEALLTFSFMAMAATYLFIVSLGWKVVSRTQSMAVAAHIDTESAAANQAHRTDPGVAKVRKA